ncbi:HNH endonuclease [Bradyrhizobium vignae]|uniref:HNH endonuclease n=1 Tax=Bradyrhizobium vignae TaxID=1549949 RepID=UPI00100BB80B|nr:HNH endonuclease [Bradyrhizobium vignae]
MICIWCRNEFERLSTEHGIPESLGCPKDLVLRNVVCVNCNNALGTVDQALLKQFEVATVVYGVCRKGGRRPTIDGWRAISSKHLETGQHIFINAGPQIVEAEGKRLHPAAKSNGIFDTWIDPEAGRLGFSQEFGNDPRFVRALYKIGLNLVARHYGVTEAADTQYEHIRAFVWGRPDAPKLRAVMDTTQTLGPVTGASNPIVKDGRDFPLFSVAILGLMFLIDMSPQQPGLRDLEAAATLRNESLVFLPPRRPSSSC